ncbi:hypothetical protein J6590_072940 [Homalodisca vitripennis]|nr:hypothetical protein J6590_072940 [Homalodisca vitripennis]
MRHVKTRCRIGNILTASRKGDTLLNHANLPFPKPGRLPDTVSSAPQQWSLSLVSAHCEALVTWSEIARRDSTVSEGL